MANLFSNILKKVTEKIDSNRNDESTHANNIPPLGLQLQ